MTADSAPLVTSATDVVSDSIDFSGKRVLDVGCGTGGLARWLSANGAIVTGVETQVDLIEDAGKHPSRGSEDYVEGRGEAIPFADEEIDIVIFSFSLHHVPAKVMRDALREARRVLKPDGVVLVVEPVADGDYFEVTRIIDDETEVRRLALEALKDTDAHGLTLGKERFYRMRHHFENVEVMIKRLIQVDPARKPIIEANLDELKARFIARGQPTEAGYRFEMTIRSNVLLK